MNKPYYYFNKSNSTAGVLRVEVNLPRTSTTCIISFIANAWQENVCP